MRCTSGGAAAQWWCGCKTRPGSRAGDPLTSVWRRCWTRGGRGPSCARPCHPPRIQTRRFRHKRRHSLLNRSRTRRLSSSRRTRPRRSHSRSLFLPPHHPTSARTFHVFYLRRETIICYLIGSARRQYEFKA